MNILYVITDLETGGSEKKLAYLCAALDRRRFQPVVAALAGGPVADDIRKRGIPLYVLEARVTHILSVVWMLCRIIRRHRIDAVHSFLFHANIVGALAGWLSRRPVIWSVETLEGPGWHHSLSRLFRWVPRHVFCVSNAVRDFFCTHTGLSIGAASVVYNGVPVPHGDSTPARSHDPVIVTASRLAHGKGIEDVIEAVALMDHDRIRPVLWIVGDGEERGRLEQLTRQRGLQDRVQFMGWQKDVPGLLAEADLFVQASHLREGLPLSILEAMAAGKPVVATDTGGTGELVEDGHTGSLIRAGDVHGLYNEMKQLLSDPDLRGRMGRAARERVQRQFCAETMSEGYVRIYERVA